LAFASEEYGSYYYYDEELTYDPCANCKPNFDSNQYLKIEGSLAKENYNLIEKHNFLKELEIDDD
jgi:hypothetical protein